MNVNINDLQELEDAAEAIVSIIDELEAEGNSTTGFLRRLVGWRSSIDAFRTECRRHRGSVSGTLDDSE